MAEEEGADDEEQESEEPSGVEKKKAKGNKKTRKRRKLAREAGSPGAKASAPADPKASAPAGPKSSAPAGPKSSAPAGPQREKKTRASEPASGSRASGSRDAPQLGPIHSKFCSWFRWHRAVGVNLACGFAFQDRGSGGGGRAPGVDG